MSKWLLLLIAFLSKATLKLISQCPSFQVKPLMDKMQCLDKLTESEYWIQECPPDLKCFIDEYGDKGECELSNSYLFEQVYPGGKCISDDDCYSLKCSNGKCQGVPLGSQCHQTADCSFGQSCFDGFCNYPKPKNSLCEDQAECKFPLYCFKSRCTQLFSLDNGAEVEEDNHFLCKSGKVYEGKCNQIKNINTECDDNTPCQYEDALGGKLEIEAFCKCPYESQPNAQRKCLRGDLGNEDWEKALAILKETMKEENTAMCNLEEKRPGFCLEQLKHTWSFRQKQIQLETLLIDAQYEAHIPSQGKRIIYRSLFGLDITPIKPENGFQCPLYTTNFTKGFVDKETCVYGVNPFNEEGDQLMAFVNKNACAEGYRCNYDMNNIAKDWTYNATCLEKTFWKSSYHLHLPGDQCETSEQCQKGNYPDVGLCSNNKCSGHMEGGNCTTHIDCFNGLHCGQAHICAKQKEEGGQCVDDYDCLNKYGCMNNTCFAFYSLPNGAYLNKDNPNTAFCEFCTENEKTHQCVKLSYEGNSKEDDNGFIECSSTHQQCNYTNGYELLTKPCQCGYNKFGKAFCPLSQNEHQSEWGKYFNKKKSVFDNSCHTLKRNDCPGYAFTDEISYYQRLSEKAHLFYLAEDDVIAVLHGFHQAASRMSMLMMLFLSVL